MFFKDKRNIPPSSATTPPTSPRAQEGRASPPLSPSSQQPQVPFSPISPVSPAPKLEVKTTTTGRVSPSTTKLSRAQQLKQLIATFAKEAEPSLTAQHEIFRAWLTVEYRFEYVLFKARDDQNLLDMLKRVTFSLLCKEGIPFAEKKQILTAYAKTNMFKHLLEMALQPRYKKLKEVLQAKEYEEIIQSVGATCTPFRTQRVALQYSNISETQQLPLGRSSFDMLLGVYCYLEWSDLYGRLKKTNYQEQLKAGLKSMQAGDFSAAKIALQTAAAHHNNLALKLMLIHCEIELGNFLVALEALEKLQKETPDHSNILKQLVFAYLATGNVKQAEAVAQKLASLAPDYPYAILQLANHYKQTGNYVLAHQYFDQLLRKFHNQTSPVDNKAFCAALVGKYQTYRRQAEDKGENAAGEFLVKVLQKFPPHHQLWRQNPELIVIREDKVAGAEYKIEEQGINNLVKKHLISEFNGAKEEVRFEAQFIGYSYLMKGVHLQDFNALHRFVQFAFEVIVSAAQQKKPLKSNIIELAIQQTRLAVPLHGAPACLLLSSLLSLCGEYFNALFTKPAHAPAGFFINKDIISPDPRLLGSARSIHSETKSSDLTTTPVVLIPQQRREGKYYIEALRYAVAARVLEKHCAVQIANGCLDGKGMDKCVFICKAVPSWQKFESKIIKRVVGLQYDAETIARFKTQGEAIAKEVLESASVNLGLDLLPQPSR